MPCTRLGLLGGSFDPPHLGHVQLARDACAALGLDEIAFVIAGDPWQKRDRRLAAAEHRLAMLKLTLSAFDLARIETCELDRDGATYTIDTLETLQARRPGVQLVWVLGSDQHERLHTWHRHDELTRFADLAVACRDGARSAAIDALPDAGRLPARCASAAAPGLQVRFVMQAHPASSTAIRADARACAHWLAPGVLPYIETHGLYP